MTKDTIILNINDIAALEFVLPNQLKDLFRFDEIKINFISNKNKHELFSHDFALYAFECLKKGLEDLLCGYRALHKSINKDIGYLWNMDTYGQPKNLIYYSNAEGQKFWIGSLYSVWGGKDSATWLYEKNGLYYFEITPIYSWLTEEEKSDYQTYKEFMKNYKPYIVTTIRKSTAKKWLKKLEKIIKIIEDNDKKYFIDHPEHYRYCIEGNKLCTGSNHK